MPNDAAANLKALAAFLADYDLDDEKFLKVLTDFGISSMTLLLRIKQDTTKNGPLEKLRKSITDSKILYASASFDEIDVNSIENAIEDAETPGAAEAAKALAVFLARHDLGGKKLLRILRSEGVKSLPTLEKIKKDTGGKLKALNDKIGKWKAGAAEKFEAVTLAMVTAAIAGETPVESDPESVLQFTAFLKRNKLDMPAFPKILTGFGVKSLQQLKAVKEDRGEGGQLEKLREKIKTSGILYALKFFDELEVSAIEKEIDELSSPAAAEVQKRRKVIDDAISEIEKLREEVKKSGDAQFTAIKSDVEKAHDAALQKIKDVCGVEFATASQAAAQSKKDLDSLFEKTIQSAQSTNRILDEVIKVPRTMTEIINKQQMLCGFLINPGGVFRKDVDLIRIPEKLDQMSKDSGKQDSTVITYKGTKTESFASSYVNSTGFALAADASGSGGGFVGSGVGAVSVAASYADAKKASAAAEQFQSGTEAWCGEVRCLYVPKTRILFDRNEIKLSDRAARTLAEIAAISETDTEARITRIREFYRNL